MTASLPALVDSGGLPLRRRASTDGRDSAHAGASVYSTELSNWWPSLKSADAEYLPERDRLAARTHDIARNNGWVSGTMQRYVDQAIGAKFRLSYRPDYIALGLTPEWARSFAREVEARFRLWANDPRCYCDAAERNQFSGLMGLGFRHRLLDGETVILPQWIPGRARNVYATALQMIDPDRLSTPMGAMENSRFRGGVETDDYGAPVAYHIRATHPGDPYAPGAEIMTWKRIPRRTRWGRQQVIHFFEQDRAGQTRGKSLLAPILERLKMEDRYARIEMQAALVNAIFAAFIESPMDSALVEDGLISETGVKSYQDLRAEFHNDRRIALDGVRIPHLFPGEKFNFSAANRPHAGFADFERAFLRYFAAAMGQSYEQVAQDWSQTNYSSARAAMLESWKFLTARRTAFADGAATPAFALWLEEAIDRGDVVLPAGAPDFWEAFPAWTNCLWLGPGRGWVDPVKEAEAAQVRMDTGVSTLQDEAAEQGKDWEQTLEQQAAEQARRRELGLPDPVSREISESASETSGGDPDAADREERRQSGGARS